MPNLLYFSCRLLHFSKEMDENKTSDESCLLFILLVEIVINLHCFEVDGWNTIRVNNWTTSNDQCHTRRGLISYCFYFLLRTSSNLNGLGQIHAFNMLGHVVWILSRTSDALGQHIPHLRTSNRFSICSSLRMSSNLCWFGVACAHYHLSSKLSVGTMSMKRNVNNFSKQRFDL